MNRILSRRLLRDIKKNFMRYFALFLLIVMGMYIVISVVAAADNIIIGTALRAEENKVESGEFSVFLPLTGEQTDALHDMGIVLEEKFSMDIELEDGSVLRLMKNRTDINLIDLDEGRLAEKDNEAVLEKRYCEVHGYKTNDTVKIAGRDFEIVGIGSTPDYDMPVNEISDFAVESTLFGTAFVTAEQYEEILAEGLQKAEDYTYAYRLSGEVTDEDVKQAIKSFDFNYEDVQDKYFKEAVENTIGKKVDLQEGINSLCNGSEQLSDGLSELSDSSSELTDAAEEIFSRYLAQASAGLAAMGAEEMLTADNYSDVLDNYIALTGSEDLVSLRETLHGLNNFLDGIKEYTSGVSEAKDGAAKLTDGTAELKTEADKLLDELFVFEMNNLTAFIKADDNPRILAAAGDTLMNKEAGLIGGVIVIALFAYVISVFVIHQIQRESSVIGTLYALGAKKKNLLLHYITLPTLITFLGGVAGSALGFSDIGMIYQEADSYNYFSLPAIDKIYPIYLIIYAIIMPPLISVVVNSLVINKRLSKTALSLIRDEQNQSKRLDINLKGGSFVRNFRIRQMLRESRTSVTVVIGMFISLLIFMLGFNSYTLCANVREDNKASTKFEYMYTLKYPSDDVPEGGEACYIESLTKTELGYTLDISVIGIDADNKYYDVNPASGKSSIIIGSSVAQKYKLSEGSKLILTDSAEGVDYAFTVDGICDYSVGLTVFMDIDSMRELFGQEEDYYNMVLSDEALNIEEGRLYSVTTRSDVERSSAVFIELMMPLVVTMIGVSIIIFCVVMYLMVGVMIDRASTGISLIKIFGYKTKEVRKLYLNGNTIIILIGAIICIPLSKAAMDAIYPWLIANTACGMNLHFSWYIYLAILAAIMVIYFVINRLLERKINKITPAEILKNRE